VNPYINAVVEDRYGDALREAQEVDTFTASRIKTEEEIEKETPLLGVPITVKESCGVKGCMMSDAFAKYLIQNKMSLPRKVTNKY
jgi:fatty acid amide hydrolase 2